MTGRDLRVVRYRLRAGFGRRRGGYLALVLLVGLVGGVAMGAVAAARRTGSSFSAYLASTSPSNLSVSVYGGRNGNSENVSYSPPAVRKIARLAGVKHVGAAITLTAFPLLPGGAPRLGTGTLDSTIPVASVNGLYFSQDRLAVRVGWPTLTGRTRS